MGEIGVSFFVSILHNRPMNTLQQIFTDYYEVIKYTLNPRPVEMENIDKMIHCGDSSHGGVMYGCPHCGELKFVPFRCHSRFCPTCGAKYALERAASISFSLIQCHHRHCVFTIDEQLRPFFLKDRSLLNCLFSAVRSVILRMFHKINKSKNYTPGFICVLHTFGRPLEWNPHIHCIISEGGFSDDSFFKCITHFDYKFLRMSFQTALLNELELKIGPSFKKVKAAIYKKDKNGFYVYAKPNICDTSTISKYISRYLGRPVIALSRIDSYDGNNVTFHYNRHEDNAFVRKTIPALEFIKLLIQHIPEKHFKMTRYYGLYARHREQDKVLHKRISEQKKRFLLSLLQWRTLYLISLGYDPLECPKCKHKMLFLELYEKHSPVPLFEMYQKVMAKCRTG